MTHDEIKQAIANTRKEVESWPMWKQNILTDSAKPMFDRPREPIVHQQRPDPCERCGSPLEVCICCGDPDCEVCS